MSRVAELEAALRDALDLCILDGFSVHDVQKLARCRAALDPARNIVADGMEQDARRWLDSNTTYYDVDADFDVEGVNVPTLAQVSQRIWYHATDDQTSYPFSAVIDAALAKEIEK